MFYPTHYTLVSGIGKDEFQLVSFDNALFDAGVYNYNLVKVSSILPSECVYSPAVTAKPGSIVFAAYSTKSLNEQGIISSTIGVGVPKDSKNIGVIMEYSNNGDAIVSESNVKTMVEGAMDLREIPIDKIKTTSIEATASNDKFTTVFSALIMWWFICIEYKSDLTKSWSCTFSLDQLFC